MAGSGSIKSYYDKDVHIEYKKDFSEFDVSEPGKHLSQETIESGDIRLIEMDDIFYKLEYTSYNRQKIEVSHSKTLKEADINFPDEEFVRGFADIFADEGTVIVWLNSTWQPMYTSGKGDGRLLDMKYWKETDPLNLEDLVTKSLDEKFKISKLAIVSADGKLFYIRDNDMMSKLFIPFMMEWFEERFPGLMVSDEHSNCATISKLGFRVLLQMYIMSAFGYLNTAPVTFQSGSYFSVSIPEIIESPLGGGIKLKEGQLKSIAHMLPIKAKLSLKDAPYFDGKILTDPEGIELSYNEHVDCTWHTFIHATEFFPIGCTIHLAPGQVILDSNDNEVFSEFNIASLVYHGPEFLLPDKQNSMEVIVTGDSIDSDLRTRMIKYFDRYFDLSIHAWKLEGKRAK